MNLECFVRSAETASFSEAARRLSLTPAAVSRNVAALERNLGVRLFHRSTRSLTITEAGERLFVGIDQKLAGLQAALSEVAAGSEKPSGTLRVSMPMTFGLKHLLPLLPDFMATYPEVRIDWQLDNQPADLVDGRLDLAIGGGFDLPLGVTARRLAPIHLVVVAAPAYMAGRSMPTTPSDLAGLAAIGMRLPSSGRVSGWTMRNRAGEEAGDTPAWTTAFNDPLPVLQAALGGLGVAMLALPDVLDHLADGSLVRLLPDWYADRGQISLYYSSTPSSLPQKARVFIDHVVGQLQEQELAERCHALAL